MTLSEFQTILHHLYQGDDDVPGVNDEDYTVRTKLLEVSISVWAAERQTQWRELWATASGTTSSGSSISLSSFTDFVFAGGFLRIKIDGINWTYIPIVDQPKSELSKGASGDPQQAWIVGNKKTGYTVYLSFTVAASLSWELPYYKEPFIPTSAAHVIEMRDPYFAVYLSLSKLHETDGEGDRASLALSMADERLRSMRALNGKAPNYQENYVPDQDFELGVGGFGE